MPAYVVRREGTVFTGVCLLTFVGGGCPVAGLGGGGTPSHVWVEGVPRPGLDGGGTAFLEWGLGGGVPQPGLDGRGGTPARSGTLGGTPFLGWGVPQPGLDGGGYPIPGVGGTLARSGWWGYPRYSPPARSGWWGGTPGTPHPLARPA